MFTRAGDSGSRSGGQKLNSVSAASKADGHSEFLSLPVKNLRQARCNTLGQAGDGLDLVAGLSRRRAEAGASTPLRAPPIHTKAKRSEETAGPSRHGLRHFQVSSRHARRAPMHGRGAPAGNFYPENPHNIPVHRHCMRRYVWGRCMLRVAGACTGTAASNLFCLHSEDSYWRIGLIVEDKKASQTLTYSP